MFKSTLRSNLIGSLFGLAILGMSSTAIADSGFFLGGSVGTATVSADVPDPGFGNDINFDEDDFAWKVYGGYAFDLPVIDLGVELGYFDLGSPTMDVAGGKAGIGVSGYEAFALLGVNLGPVGVFVKGGIASWDADIFIANVRGSEDGSDPAYGVGLRFALGSVEIRGEYEILDIENSEDVYMASAGLVWRF